MTIARPPKGDAVALAVAGSAQRAKASDEPRVSAMRAPSDRVALIVDFSHRAPGRKVTGLERIAEEMFAPGSANLADAVGAVRHLHTPASANMLATQLVGLPLAALAHRRALILCPSFPPSPPLSVMAPDRTIAYIHDLFLLTRPDDLNYRARTYLRPAFALALARLRTFCTNSEYTKRELEKHCRRDADITLLRPEIRNVFALPPLSDRDADRAGARAAEEGGDQPVRLLALGTIEPRKNLTAAVNLRAALEERLRRPVRLDIVGREGWGEEAARIKTAPSTIVHGYCPPERIAALVADSDFFVSLSKDEGLGLPLLELQYGGLAVIASNISAFRETLGDSALFVDADKPQQGADKVAALFGQPHWRSQARRAALDNLRRWNNLAARDMTAFKSWLRDKTATVR